MSIVGAFVLPHPPLAVAGVGRGEEAKISTTLAGYREVARRIASLEPETVVVSSPHATAYYDYIHISPGAHASGDFSNFGDPDDEVSVDYDEELVNVICQQAAAVGLPAGIEGERGSSLTDDHGTMVPLSFVQAAGVRCPIVRIGISGLSPLDHYDLGRCVARAAGKLDRRVVWLASGDLSHKLSEASPYGYSPDGPVFDEVMCEAFSSGDFLRLLTVDHGLCERAAECGLRSFQMMAGSLDGRSVSAELISHEGPFGIGYGVAAFVPTGADPDRRFGERYREIHARRIAEVRAAEDPWVGVARASAESWVRSRRRLEVPDDLPQSLRDRIPEELLATRAGCFCSVKKNGELRGCIGTTSPTRGCLAQEIADNAVSAVSRDPRFDPVTPDELDELVYDVDVLDEPQGIAGTDELDPRRYGVIVSAADGRRGLLLPDLDGVDTVDKQVSIARRKGGIGPDEPVSLQRFEVARHV